VHAREKPQPTGSCTGTLAGALALAAMGDLGQFQTAQAGRQSVPSIPRRTSDGNAAFSPTDTSPQHCRSTHSNQFHPSPQAGPADASPQHYRSTHSNQFHPSVQAGPAFASSEPTGFDADDSSVDNIFLATLPADDEAGPDAYSPFASPIPEAVPEPANYTQPYPPDWATPARHDPRHSTSSQQQGYVTTQPYPAETPQHTPHPAPHGATSPGLNEHGEVVHTHRRRQPSKLKYHGNTKSIQLRLAHLEMVKAGKKKKKADGFDNQAAREDQIVWEEMGNLSREPYDTKKMLELKNAFMARDKKLPNSWEPVPKGAKLREFTRSEGMAKSVQTERELKCTLKKEADIAKLNFNPRVSDVHKELYTGDAGKQLTNEFGWQPPANFAVFSPTEYAAERTAKIEDAELHRWRTCEPLWQAIPEFMEKPIRDTGDCD